MAQLRRAAGWVAATVAAAIALAGCTIATMPAATTATRPSGIACPSGKIIGEGSTAQATAMSEIAVMYGDVCGRAATIDYAALGSGSGVRSFVGGLVDFAGSDSPLKTTAVAGATSEADRARTRCAGNPAWSLPLVVGPVAFAFNLPNVTSLNLTATALAKIFTGAITRWDDAELATLNPTVALPGQPIRPVFRSDESGTSENVSAYLHAAAPGAWPEPANKKWTGTAGTGTAKSAGVTDAVKATPYSITYTEWSYANEAKLPTAAIDSGRGAVALSAASVAAAVDAAKVAGSGNDLRLELAYTNLPAGVYPAVLVSYEIVCSKGLAADKTALLKDYLRFFAGPAAQQQLVTLGFGPLPDGLRQRVLGAVAAIA